MFSLKSKVLLFFLASWAISLEAQTSKNALIIAIGDYPTESGWNSLNTKSDAKLIKAALMKQGFSESDIVVLQDENATRQGIISSFKEYLINKVKEGGIAFFHFSGHGQQILDDNDDELDGLDEALVSFDSPMYYKEGVYEGERLIRDEELGELLSELRDKLGSNGQVLVNIDACHSGTGTRGFSTARGTHVKMIPSSTNLTIEIDESNSLEELNIYSEDAAPMISFFASSANELNYESFIKEGIASGSFSYAFSKVFSSCDKHSSYQGLFDRIKIEMSVLSPRQHPQAEGNLNQRVMNGKLIGNSNHYNVLNVFENFVVIEGGTLIGLFPNTRVSFYPLDTHEPSKSKAITAGVITNAHFLNSQIRLDSSISHSELLKTWAYVDQLHYGELSISVKVDIDDEKLSRTISQEISMNSVIQLADNGAELLIDFDQENEVIRLLGKDGFVLYKQKNKDQYDSLLNEIYKYTQAKFLRGLEMIDPWLDVEIELLYLTEDSDFLKQETKYKLSSDGNLRLSNNSKIKVRLTNVGEVPAYFALLDIQPDNKINLILPESHLSRKPEEYYLLPGQSIDLPDKNKNTRNDYWTLGPPYGIEVLKLIATQEPINLRAIIKTRGASQANDQNSHPFELLFKSTFPITIGNTRGQTRSLPINSTQISSLIFQIEDK